MGCNSGKVENVAASSDTAAQALVTLESTINKQDQAFQAKFEEDITRHLQNAQLTDAVEIGYNRHVKTEYVSEFSLDAVAGVITKILKSTLATYTAGANPVLSKSAVDSYVDVVAAVAEAAKSSSSSTGDFTFSMTRIAPGLIVFLYAVSESLSDSGTFGTEAITTTAIYYKLVESKQDVVKAADFEALSVAAATYVTARYILLKLAERLAADPFLVDDPEALFDKYDRLVKRAKADMDELAGRRKGGPLLATSAATPPKLEMDTQPVHHALRSLSAKGDRFAKLIADTRLRLEEFEG